MLDPGSTQPDSMFSLAQVLHDQDQGGRFFRFGQGSLDNATILAVGLYHRYFSLFETVLKREGGSIREMILFFREVSKQDGDVLEKTQRWLQGGPTPHT